MKMKSGRNTIYAVTKVGQVDYHIVALCSAPDDARAIAREEYDGQGEIFIEEYVDGEVYHVV